MNKEIFKLLYFCPELPAQIERKSLDSHSAQPALSAAEWEGVKNDNNQQLLPT